MKQTKIIFKTTLFVGSLLLLPAVLVVTTLVLGKSLKGKSQI